MSSASTVLSLRSKASRASRATSGSGHSDHDSHSSASIAARREAEALAEADRWLQSFDDIPEEMQPLYARELEQHTINNKIRILKLVHSIEYDLQLGPFIVEVFQHCRSKENLDKLFYVMDLVGPEQLVIVLVVLRNIDYQCVHELLYETPEEEILKIIDVLSYQEKTEFDLIFDFIERLSFKEVASIVEECNHPRAEKCRLCKAQRLASLEYRLMQSQLRPDCVDGWMPGMEGLLDRADVWKHDVAMEFTFLHDKGIVYWRKERVDTMNICDKCLNNVMRAAGNVARLEPIHSTDATNRKELLAHSRALEQERSVLFRNLSRERHRRRMREWALRALKKRRLDIVQADNEMSKAEREKEEKQRAADVEESHRVLVNTSMAFDQKWRSKMNYHQMKRNHKLLDMATLRNLPDFTLDNQVHASREHPHSWRLRLYVDNPIPPEKADQALAKGKASTNDPGYSIQMPGGARGTMNRMPSSVGAPSFPAAPVPGGNQEASVRRTTSAGGAPGAAKGSSDVVHRDPVPVHIETASSRFGTALYEPDTRLRELEKFKKEAVAFDDKVTAKERRLAAEARAKAEEEYRATLAYLADQRSKEIARQTVKEMTDAHEEEQRLIARRAFKARCRAEKIAKQEGVERGLMDLEDKRSVAYQFFMWETAQITRERHEMAGEEALQWSKGDRFFGIIAHQLEMHRQAELKHAAWMREVDRWREMCVNVDITKPFRDEKNKFLDFEFHLPIPID